MGIFKKKTKQKPAKKSSAKTQLNNVRQNKSKSTKNSSKKKQSNVGKVYRGQTKYIDKETKAERNYVVVVDNGKKVSVAKLKSIKIFDEAGRNADKALVEINASRYGLEQRTGIDFERFSKNRMSGKDLKLSDEKVFPEQKECFKLGSHDTSRAIRHTSKRQKK